MGFARQGLRRWYGLAKQLRHARTIIFRRSGGVHCTKGTSCTAAARVLPPHLPLSALPGSKALRHQQ